MKRLAVLVSVVILLSGCATSSPQKALWVPGGGQILSQEDFARDKYQCVQESRTSWSGGGTGLVGLAVMAGAKSNADKTANGLFKMCMEAHGWVLQTPEEAEQFAAVKKQLEARSATPGNGDHRHLCVNGT